MKNKIKCSQCNKEFPHGDVYRKHWIEKHLKQYELRRAKDENNISWKESSRAAYQSS